MARQFWQSTTPPKSTKDHPTHSGGNGKRSYPLGNPEENNALKEADAALKQNSTDHRILTRDYPAQGQIVTKKDVDKAKRDASRDSASYKKSEDAQDNIINIKRRLGKV